jgi:hypothetical protein
VIPDELRYENLQKEGFGGGKNIINFGRLAERKYVFETSPYPGVAGFEPAHANERRFDLPPVKFENLSRHRDTSHAPLLENYAKRSELWQVIDLPDSQIYAQQF